VIRTERLSKRYGTHPALVDLDLSVHAGEVFGFLGPNGAGKSTTIRILLDLLRPSAGKVEIFGKDPRRGGPSLRNRTGYLPGEFVVYDRQSADELLTGLGRLRGGVAHARITDLADRLDLDLKRPIRELSKGNRQKVGLVQAFMHQPELLILDEPTSGLDPLLRKEFLTLVDEVRANGRTVFLSSHILSEVQSAADRVGMIRGGRLVAVDSVTALRERAVRRVEIQFEDGLAPSQLAGVSNFNDITVTREGTQTVVRGNLTGSADALIKFAAGHTVRNLLVEEPDLEEVFLALYEAS
jgi:ABC-2 type transport system ATP-binding protein